ncbi:MAG: LEA type 2 family protein [Planctomycetota bacterium]
MAILGGCSAYDAPSIRVASVEVADRSDEAVVIEFTLDAENTNDVALPLKTLRYTVRINGRPVARVMRSGEATLRRVGTQQIVLPAAVRLSDLRDAGDDAAYEMTGRLTYVTPGEFAQRLFDVGVRRPSVRFTAEGRLDLSGGARPSGPAADPPPTP